MRSDFRSGKTWAPQGETPIVRVTGQRFSLNMISSISPRGALRFMVVSGEAGANVLISFLNRLMHEQHRPASLIVDGHPSHRVKGVKEYVDSIEGRLKLFLLPPVLPRSSPRRTRLERCEEQRCHSRQARRPQGFTRRGRQAATLPAEASRSRPQLVPGAGYMVRSRVAADTYYRSAIAEADDRGMNHLEPAPPIFQFTVSGIGAGCGSDTNPPVEMTMLSYQISNGCGSVCAHPKKPMELMGPLPGLRL